MTPTSELLASSQSFLIEALRNHLASRDRFAILHAVIAVELALKERLHRINPGLVLEDIDLPERGRTVGLTDIPRRLSNLGHGLDAREEGLVRQFAEWRNEIVHHHPRYDETAAAKQLPTLLNFLAEYIYRELGTPLRDFLPHDLFGPAQDAIDKWRVVVQEAQKRARDEGSVIAQPCPTCSIADVVCACKEGRTRCHICGSEADLQVCGVCTFPVLASFMRLDNGAMCFNCTGKFLRVSVVDPLAANS
jgi:hypothetical protein